MGSRKSGTGPAFERLQYGDLVALYVEDKVMLLTPPPLARATP